MQTQQRKSSQPKVTNLKSLANHLGLSQTTVSRALNGYSDVSIATKERVRKAAEELGYRPNASARRLATGRSNVIGIAFPTEHSLLVEPNFMEFLAGLSENAAANDADIMISATTGFESDVYERFALRGSVDLVVLSNIYLSEERIGRLKQLGLPFIVHGTAPSSYSYAYLDIDNYSVFYEPTKLLLGLGHKRIAILNGERDRTFAIDRRNGYQSALEERDIQPDPELQYHSEMSESFGYAHMKKLLALKEPPTAVLCSHVLMAKGVYRACSKAGKVVGRDISVFAHDDVLPTFDVEQFEPPLATTRSSLREAGKEVAQMAQRMLDGAPIEELQQKWRVEFVYRPSIAAVPYKV
ncbi:substrate-binding domain-containing protein [Polycladidibacter stylochi]|uniref:substrate-binding domain-containing protein n=1 Tax=Polycladidibacter stylochi TaxID=1807766 RepID=UPI00083272CA|nr:substrate-binding domain-containing protein [Pseudovibrio stylochi]